MEATKIIIIRHGETTWNKMGRCQGQLDSPLTETGIAQAKALAERMADTEFDVLYSSDLGRTRDTAKFIAQKTNQTINFDARLRERHFGVREGLTLKEFEAQHPQAYAAFKSEDPDYPIGESMTEFYHRCVTCLEDLAERHFGKVVAIVTHGGVITSLFKYTLLLPITTPRLYKGWNTSVNIVSYYHSKEKWLLETWGDVQHLEDYNVEETFNF